MRFPAGLTSPTAHLPPWAHVFAMVVVVVAGDESYENERTGRTYASPEVSCVLRPEIKSVFMRATPEAPFQ